MTSTMSLEEAGKAYLEYLATQGKKVGTLYTYRQDLKLIQAYFGPECRVSDIRVTQVGKFYKSEGLLLLASGKERATRTVKKTVRFFRLMMTWLHEQGVVRTLPLPQKEPA
jgi:site-specific recombinase XerD